MKNIIILTLYSLLYMINEYLFILSVKSFIIVYYTKIKKKNFLLNMHL